MSTPPVAVLRSAFAIALLLSLPTACSDTNAAGEREEVPTEMADVPEVVRNAVAGYCARIGGVTSGAWFWDREDRCWECELTGLLRRAELDITPEGRFAELELVYDLEEIEAALPGVAAVIRDHAGEGEGLLIELSLRHEEFLDSIPSLAKAWEQDGVVLEFQRPGGHDFELDARGQLATRAIDDSDGR